MENLSQLPCRDGSGHLLAVVEAPAGSNAKFKYDPSKRAFLLQRNLPLGLTYPGAWGFVPGTIAPDGDPLDILVTVDCDTWPGVVIPCVALGVLQVMQRPHVSDEWRSNDRIIAVAASSAHISGNRQLSGQVRSELESFFAKAADTANKEVKVIGWQDAAAAEALADRLAATYEQERP